MATYEGYCVKCKEKRQFEGQEVTLANGRPAAQGTLPGLRHQDEPHARAARSNRHGVRAVTRARG